jgi:RNA polymerase sigma factor (sigma-70 family)
MRQNFITILPPAGDIYLKGLMHLGASAMAKGQLGVLLDCLRDGSLAGVAATRLDSQLLQEFITRRDDEVFAALVRRHGPMVMGVCRRLLRCSQDAEDAFQATFLVLARKAASIRPREKLASWLYGVAYRAAQKARVAAARRGAREIQLPELPEPHSVADGLWHDLLPLLDVELRTLPEKFRLPIVLCDLEGMTRKQAALQLGWPMGTVAGRLAGARALLAKRLFRHGLPLSAGMLAAVLAQNAVAAPVRLTLVRTTAQLALGDLLAAAKLLPPVLLMRGVLKSMLLGKIKLVTVVALSLALVVMGFGFCLRAGEDARASKSPAGPTASNPAEQTNALSLKNYVVEAVDAAHRTISVSAMKHPIEFETRVSKMTVQKLVVEKEDERLVVKRTNVEVPVTIVVPKVTKETKVTDLPLAENARITFKGSVTKLSDIKAGTRVDLELGTEADHLVVRTIQIQP